MSAAHPDTAAVRAQLLEHLNKAEQALWFVQSDLQQANKLANPVEHLVLLPIMADTKHLSDRITVLRGHIEDCK